MAAGVFAFGTRGASASQTTYDINTLAGKVASVHGTAGLQIRFSAFIEEEAEAEASPTPNTPPINPPFVLSSPLDGSSVAAPNKQSVVWFYGFEFVPTQINQEDVVTASGNF